MLMQVAQMQQQASSSQHSSKGLVLPLQQQWQAALGSYQQQLQQQRLRQGLGP
jgi:hypothetical protein